MERRRVEMAPSAEGAAFSWPTERTPGTTSVFMLTLRTGRLADLLSRRPLRAHGLDASQLAVLVALGTIGEGAALSPGALTSVVAQTPSGVTRTVRRLEHAGLVERTPDPGDGRSVLLRLTAAGGQRMEETTAALIEHFEQLVERTGRRDLRGFVDDAVGLDTLFAELREASRAGKQPTPAPPGERGPDLASLPNSGEVETEPVGARIRRERTARGLTQRALAAAAGVGAPHLSKVESGREQPSEALLAGLAGPLGLDPDELLLSAGLVPSWMAEVLARDPTRAVRAARAWVLADEHRARPRPTRARATVG